MSDSSNVAALVGRILLAVIFIWSGIGKIEGYSGTAAYMAAHGLPMVGILLPLTILTEVGGGLLLVLGLKARWAAVWLFLYMIPTTLIFHRYWGVDPKLAMEQEINFYKNVAMMGGMLMVAAFGPGRLSFDRR